MTRAFDDLTLTLKQNYVTMTKAVGDTKVKHISLLILKISGLSKNLVKPWA